MSEKDDETVNTLKSLQSALDQSTSDKARGAIIGEIEKLTIAGRTPELSKNKEGERS